MAVTLVHLFETALFLLNAMAILNERRFLKRCNKVSFYSQNFLDGWDKPDMQATIDSAGVSFLKGQAIILLYTVRTYGKCNL